MGDRGGTATTSLMSNARGHYTRWEIGGEPQRNDTVFAWSVIIPDGRSGGNRNASYRRQETGRLYPMGDRGGTATRSIWSSSSADYTRWEIGGEPQLSHALYVNTSLLYPMGDRGGTATVIGRVRYLVHYTRWEIGGEPQRTTNARLIRAIIPDGRSGGNRNQWALRVQLCTDYTRWEIGGEPQPNPTA